jgi:hypothetical protein
MVTPTAEPERECLGGERTRIVNRKKGTLARLGIHNFNRQGARRRSVWRWYTRRRLARCRRMSPPTSSTPETVLGARGRALAFLASGRSEAALAGGPEHYRHRCDGRRYLAGWLQFTGLRVDLELHDCVALLVGDV